MGKKHAKPFHDVYYQSQTKHKIIMSCAFSKPHSILPQTGSKLHIRPFQEVGLGLSLATDDRRDLTGKQWPRCLPPVFRVVCHYYAILNRTSPSIHRRCHIIVMLHSCISCGTLQDDADATERKPSNLTPVGSQAVPIRGFPPLSNCATPGTKFTHRLSSV